MKPPIAATALFLAAIGSFGAQQPTRAVSGSVVDANTGGAIARARIIVYAGQKATAVLLADNEGRFSLAAVPNERQRLVISKAGYAAAEIAVADTVGSEPVTARLRRGGAISGRVIDARGEPYSNAVVNLIQPRQTNDIPTLKTAVTDNLGEYRLFGIPPANDYVVELAVMQRDMLAVFYPGTDKIDAAERIVVRAGAEKSGVDFMTDTARPLPSIETHLPPLLIESVLNSRIRTREDAEQAPPPGTGVIGGRVRLPSGAPLSAATVTVLSLSDVLSPRPPRSTVTDNQGRFSFDRLPAAEYVFSAAKTGYVSADDVNRDPQSAVPVRLADGEARRDVDVVLTPPAVITGRVLDEFGEPFEGALVSVWRVGYDAGRHRLVNISVALNPADDRGRYRVINVPPGRYLVAASAGQMTTAQPIGDLPGYALTYFPGTATPSDAQLISIAGAVPDLDIRLVRAPTAQVRGRVLLSQAGQFFPLTLTVSNRSKATVSAVFNAVRERDGQFEFRNVPPGDYVLQAERARLSPSTEGDFASQFVTVTGTDVTNVVLQSAPGSTIAGHVTFAGPAPPPNAGLVVVPVSADFDLAPRGARSVARADVTRDNTFEIRNVHGPRRIEIEQVPTGWALKSVFANGLDVTDRALPFGEAQQSLSGVEVVLTNQLTELAGSVADSRGSLTRGYALLVFSVDRERWYPGSRFFRRASPDDRGAFTVRGLPPGDYYVAAISPASVPRDGDTAWQDPEFLESTASRAAFASLSDGQLLSVSARVITP